MLCHKHNIGFIHIPKCAGSTIEHWMETALDADGYERNPERNVPFRVREGRFGDAMNLHPNYFWFTFVRSPFSRFVSLWHHSNRGTNDYFRRPEIKSPHEYMEILMAGREDRMSGFDRLHHKPQSLYLPQEDLRIFDVEVRKPLDFIGRVECFDEDYRSLCNKIGHEPQAIEKKRDGKYSNWQSFIDRDLYAMISDFYRDDIALLTRLFPQNYAAEAASYEAFVDIHARQAAAPDPQAASHRL